eukprot:scaffold607_cov109-Cylindrotheca_fusiformis.AAC.2
MVRGGCRVEICGLGMGESPRRKMQVGKRNTADDDVDKIVAAEMEKLSLKEREVVYEDVHGVSDVVQETPELIANCLERMDREIDLINEKDAYEQAKLQSLDLVTGRQFRLSFLRFASFDPRMAALHLAHYFRVKLELFGTGTLTRSRITLEDIGEEATRVLELGSMQVLPNRDSKGRAVIAFAPSALEFEMASHNDLISNMTKAVWYLVSTLSEDEETQKKGVVVVLSMSGLSDRHEKCHRTLLRRLTMIAQAVPYRFVCLHYCYNSSSSFPLALLSILALAANSLIRVRMRTHKGSLSECLYKLMSFGIPVQEFPFTEDGGIQLASHEKWLEKRRKKESYLSMHPQIQGAVDLPSKYDVLWGRGKHIFRHPGNRLLHELVETYYDQYNQLSREGKTNLADQVVAVVHGYSGRFMKPDNESGMWVEASNMEAREKVSHKFRHSRAVSLKGVYRISTEPIAAGGGKRSRMMFNGS